MFYSLLILQIIAHIISDYYLQTDVIAENKNKKGFLSKYLYIHFVITLLVSWILSFRINFFWAALLIAVLHTIIDGVKKHFKKNKYIFFIDQIVHLAILTGITAYYYYHCDSNKTLIPIPDTKFLLLSLGLLIIFKPANILIKQIFQLYNIEITEEREDLKNAGKLIGNTERLLILIFVLLNQFEVVGFLLAAKSILRFKDTETSKTEYVLTGTLLSFSIAIIIGIIIVKLIRQNIF